MRNEISSRIKKIKGQINGVEKMIDQKKPCTQIIQQLTAVNAAIKGLIIKLISQDLCQSSSQKLDDSFVKKLKLLFKFQ